MKILHIYDEYYDPKEGSVPPIIFHTSRYIAEKGHEVTVLVLESEKAESFHFGPAAQYQANIGFVRLKAKRLASTPYQEVNRFPLGPVRLILDGLFAAAKINKFLKGNDFDIIHVHFPFAANFLVTLNRNLKAKTVYTAHVGEEKKRFNLDGKAPFLLKLFSPDLYLMRRVAKSVVLNEPLRNKLLAKGIDNIVVIPHGVEIEKFSQFPLDEPFKNIYGIKEPVILFAGTITPRKGVEYLLKAAEIMVNDGYKAAFILAGSTSLDTEYTRKMQEYVEARHLPVKLTGFVPYEDLMKLYLACSIFVLPSLEEGFGLVLTDALAAGKPLVGSNVGGIPIQIRDGWNGFLIEPANEKQLAEKLSYLLAHPEEGKVMGENSRRLAREELDWRIIADKYLAVYEGLQGGR